MTAPAASKRRRPDPRSGTATGSVVMPMVRAYTAGQPCPSANQPGSPGANSLRWVLVTVEPWRAFQTVTAAPPTPGPIRGSKCLAVFTLSGGGDLVVVEQNLKSTSMDVLKNRGQRTRLHWNKEHISKMAG